MSQTNLNPTGQSPGGRTFSTVRNNWGDLEKQERIGLAAFIALIATKNRAERYLKHRLLAAIRGRWRS